MTTTKSALADKLSDTQQPDSIVEDGDDHGAHLLRLMLDLQLDALLLGLGAAAVHQSHSPALDAPGATPWPRWVIEDVELARALATEAVSSGTALPATLGPERPGQDNRALLDQLTGRYESMRDLLSDLLARTTASLTSIGRNRVLELLAHCHKRLAELRALADAPRVARAQTRREHQYLPGELLG